MHRWGFMKWSNLFFCLELILSGFTVRFKPTGASLGPQCRFITELYNGFRSVSLLQSETARSLFWTTDPTPSTPTWTSERVHLSLWKMEAGSYEIEHKTRPTGNGERSQATQRRRLLHHPVVIYVNPGFTTKSTVWGSFAKIVGNVTLNVILMHIWWLNKIKIWSAYQNKWKDDMTWWEFSHIKNKRNMIRPFSSNEFLCIDLTALNGCFILCHWCKKVHLISLF